MWGLGSFEQSVDDGFKYLAKAIELGSGEACITKARLYLFGELGHEKNDMQSLRYRQLAVELDDTVFDSLANPEYLERIRNKLSSDV